MMFNLAEWIKAHIILVTAVVVVITYLYMFIKSKNDYFKIRNIPYISFLSCVGDTVTGMRRKLHMVDMFQKYYNTFPNSYYLGFYSWGNKVIMIKDLEVITRVLIKDFDHFVDRTVVEMKTESFMNKMLSTLSGHQWKNVRSAVSPTFTSKKIKIMSELVMNTMKSLNVLLRKKATNQEEIDVKDLFTMTATDAIAASIFGLDCKCLDTWKSSPPESLSILFMISRTSISVGLCPALLMAACNHHE